ncbi:hypothetical protein PQR65_03685 [Paraburkholderia nemoris]|uniref:hypothetical protein n=1 Tax=Paraburkholderia nemoris TaxID=2793076 RepID=UPI0038BC4BC3
MDCQLLPPCLSYFFTAPTVRSVPAFKNYFACFSVNLFLALSAFLLSAGVEIWIDEALGLSETVEVIGYPQVVTACRPLIFAVNSLNLPRECWVECRYDISARLRTASTSFTFSACGCWKELWSVSASYARLAVGILITLVLAGISCHLLERPFLLLGERFTVAQNRPA